jgi:hypothetical protein
MNFLRQVLGEVVRVEGDVAWVRDRDGVERTIPNDREFEPSLLSTSFTVSPTSTRGVARLPSELP